MTERDLIVVDVESTGLDEQRHVPLEVAAVNYRTGETLTFVPFTHPRYLGEAEGEAMQINRYYERGVWRQMLDPDATVQAYDELWEWLCRNRLGGANPRFDADMLRRGYSIAHFGQHHASLPDEPWHYRLSDVCSYAAGARGLAPHVVPSLKDVCNMLAVEHEEEHSALGDALAAAECYRRLTPSISLTDQALRGLIPTD